MARRNKLAELFAIQPFLEKELEPPNRADERFEIQVDVDEVRVRIRELGMDPERDLRPFLETMEVISPQAFDTEEPTEIISGNTVTGPFVNRAHGAKISPLRLAWGIFFNFGPNTFGYLSPDAVRADTKLKYTPENRALLEKLGEIMADTGRDTSEGDLVDITQHPDRIPSGFTYLGQFIDHDITRDVLSNIDHEQDARTIANGRTPVLDLDSLYNGGPAKSKVSYTFPSSGNPTAIKLALGHNTVVKHDNPQAPDHEHGGPGGVSGVMGSPKHTDVLRFNSMALIGDDRNDENLIVSQFHVLMSRFHNRMVDMFALMATFAQNARADIFVKAKLSVIRHYQWAIVHDFLPRICGQVAVDDALANVRAGIGSRFEMPVEFSVAAYRFGHSMVRGNYWLSRAHINAQFSEVFRAVTPHAADGDEPAAPPVLADMVVDFNAFFETGVDVPIFNRARLIDTALAPALEGLPGEQAMMRILASRNLVRGMALGLPSGQGLAGHFGLPMLTEAQLLSGLPANEQAILKSRSKLLLKQTPLWYYVLREAAVTQGGVRLGPLGAKIVADTFVRMLKRDPFSYLNTSQPFVPLLGVNRQFDFAELIRFSGATEPER